MAELSCRRRGSHGFCLITRTSLFLGLLMTLFYCTSGLGMSGDISDGLTCIAGTVAKLDGEDSSGLFANIKFREHLIQSCKSKKCYFNEKYKQPICGEKNTKPATKGEFPGGLRCYDGGDMTPEGVSLELGSDDFSDIQKEFGANCKSGKCSAHKKTGQPLCDFEIEKDSGSIQAGSFAAILILLIGLYFRQPMF